MRVQHLPASSSSDEIAAVMGADGAVIVDHVVSPEIMDRAVYEMTPWIQATPFGPDDFSGRRTKRTGGLIARSPQCRDLVMNPLVLGVVEKVLGHAASFQLHLTQVISIGPGEPAQTVHRDQWAFDFFPFPKGYEVQCNTIWAMSDFTEENGATRVVPGSNQLADKLRFGLSETVPAEMNKGSVLFYNGSVYHAGGANRSDQTRLGGNITYNVSWLRQEENQYLSVPQDLAKTLPIELLKLMGYQRGAYALGYVDDLRDPLAVLFPEFKATGLGDPARIAKAETASA